MTDPTSRRRRMKEGKPPPTKEELTQLEMMHAVQREQRQKEKAAKATILEMSTRDEIDDDDLKKAMVTMLLVRLSKAKDTAEVVKISQEISKLRGFYKGAGAKPQDDSSFNKVVQGLKEEQRDQHVT